LKVNPKGVWDLSKKMNVGHARPTGYRGGWVWAGMAVLGGWALSAMGAAFWVTLDPRGIVVGGRGPKWRRWVGGHR
jgi:hypothetical protein